MYRVIYESELALYSVVAQRPEHCEFLKFMLREKKVVEYREGDEGFIGCVENMYQSDDCPPLFHKDPIFRVAICEE